MFEQLKRVAMQQLMQKMAGNSLNEAATSETAEWGANSIIQTIQEKLGSGGASEVTDLFSQGGNMESNGIFQQITGKLTEKFQAQGMSAEEAQNEAKATAPDLINGLKQKFESSAEEDSAFDLGAIASMLGGSGGALGNAGNILNAAKNIFGK